MLVKLCGSIKCRADSVGPQVPDKINPTDMLNLTLTLSLPPASTPRPHIVWPPPSIFGSTDPPPAPPTKPLMIEKLTARLPGFTHYFGNLVEGNGVFFQTVRMESEETSVFVEVCRALCISRHGPESIECAGYESTRRPHQDKPCRDYWLFSYQWVFDPRHLFRVCLVSIRSAAPRMPFS
jgi:hypothetical protein